MTQTKPLKREKMSYTEPPAGLRVRLNTLNRLPHGSSSNAVIFLSVALKEAAKNDQISQCAAQVAEHFALLHLELEALSEWPVLRAEVSLGAKARMHWRMVNVQHNYLHDKDCTTLESLGEKLANYLQTLPVPHLHVVAVHWAAAVAQKINLPSKVNSLCLVDTPLLLNKFVKKQLKSRGNFGEAKKLMIDTPNIEMLWHSRKGVQKLLDGAACVAYARMKDSLTPNQWGKVIVDYLHENIE